MSRRARKETKGNQATYIFKIKIYVARSTIVVTLVVLAGWAGYYYGV